MSTLPAELFFHATPPNEDDAEEIGSHRLRSTISAMRVEHLANEVVYGGETVVNLIPAQLRELDCGRKPHRWLRLEVKVDKDGPIHCGDSLVVAEHPYSHGWVHRTPFKIGSKKGPSGRTGPPTVTSMAQALDWIEELRHDYWEKGDRLTAAISQPQGGFDRRQRNVQRNALLVFGWCENFDEIVGELKNSDVVQRLLDDTRNRRIRFTYIPANVPFLKLKWEVVDECEALMDLSIVQALAGPHRDSATWVGRPVVEKIDDIFRGHLNACNRNAAGKAIATWSFDEQRHVEREGDERE